MEATTKTLQTLTTTEVTEKPTVRPKVRIHKFTGKENHFISLVEASVLTMKYRQKAGRGTVKGGFFGRNIYDKILGQEGCMGVRNYFAQYNDGTPTLVMVGADQFGNDMIHGVLGEDLIPCPPFCGHDNLLNSDLEDRLVPVRKNGLAFTGEENHSITLAEALNFVENYRKDKEANAIKGGFFGRELYEKILGQEGCVGIRCYFAENLDGTPTIVMVGVNAKGDDMVNGIVGEDLIPCPPFCGHDNVLNPQKFVSL